MTANIAVIDIGKTNAKLALVAPDSLTEIAVVTRPNTPLSGPPYPHFDVEGHWAFLVQNLRAFHAEHGIAAISITTHGASGALIGEDGALAAPILDYEHSAIEETAGAYNALRPHFHETGSPRLAMGLNLGAQIHWQITRDPALKERIAAITTYPQYWAHRLTGILATDASSLGCHTDLWNPTRSKPSSLLAALGLPGKLAPLRPSAEVLGPILPAVAEATGLPAETPVHCGIHDSNASLLPHLLGRPEPFCVVSTGTWVIAMAIGGATIALDPARDTLTNVAATGAPVPSARFMGGREHDIALGSNPPVPSDEDIADVLTAGTMLMPALVPATGPFQGSSPRWTSGEPATGTPARSAAVAFYLALVTTRCLNLIGHRGPIIVEGPFAANRAYCLMLEAATPASTVIPMQSGTGTSKGAALLVTGAPSASLSVALDHPRPTPQIIAALAQYALEWQNRL